MLGVENTLRIHRAWHMVAAEENWIPNKVVKWIGTESGEVLEETNDNHGTAVSHCIKTITVVQWGPLTNHDPRSRSWSDDCITSNLDSVETHNEALHCIIRVTYPLNLEIVRRSRLHGAVFEVVQKRN